MKTILFISASLSPHSKSFLLIQKAIQCAEEKGFKAELIDLRQVGLPFCDGRSIADYPTNLHPIHEQIENADHLVFGVPIYCYSISGVLKNFIDLFSKAFKNKRFGICAAAGSKMSYLATADLVKILGYESGAVGVQPMVLVDRTDFDENRNVNPLVLERIERMLDAL